MKDGPVSLMAAARAADRGEGSQEAARRLLAGYEDAAEDFERSGRLEDAVMAAQIGASMAAYRHPGVHVSLRLEALLARVGATLPPVERPPGPTGRVLHVASETYAVGGHTRMIWRWIARDPGHAHALVTTAQRAAPPDGLLAAVEASGGDALALPADASMLDRSRALREAAAAADLIVVHAHPMDPVPAVAFSEAPGRPPVVVFNHADHVFWLGAAMADVLQCIRPVGLDIAAARGVAASRRLLTTAPVAGGDGNAPSDEGLRDWARPDMLRQLGWPDDSVLLLSAGSLDKYRGPAGLTLLDLVDPVLRGAPRARLLVAGAVEDDVWTAARSRHGGRVVATGPLPWLGPLFAGADVYLESQPFGGPGASSEAAAAGLPVLTHAASEPEAGFFCTDARYGTTLTIGPGEYRRALNRLIANSDERAQAGARAREAIAVTDARWEADVAEVYRAAAELGPASVAELAPEPAQDGARDLLVAQCLRNTHPDVDMRRMLALGENIALAGRSPSVRGLFGELVSMGAAPERRFPVAVAVPAGDPEALRTVSAEFLRLHAAGVADRFAIGLRTDQAEAAIPVLEAELGDAELEIDVVVDPHPEGLVQPGCLEVVVGDDPGTGRAERHVAAPPPKLAERRRRPRRR